VTHPVELIRRLAESNRTREVFGRPVFLPPTEGDRFETASFFFLL